MPHLLSQNTNVALTVYLRKDLIAMKFENDEDRSMFLNHQCYFKSPNNFCLGVTLEEAGEIILKIIENRKTKDPKKRNEE